MQTLQICDLYMTTTHVLCVYTPMQCALSCICLCHVLVCAGSVLTSVLQFFMVLVQQAIAGITFEVLFEVRRHQHISTATNLRMILQKHLYSWYFLLFPYSLLFLWCMYLFHCSAAIFIPVLLPLPFLRCSPPLLCPPHLSFPPSSPYTTQILTASSTTPRRPDSLSHQGTVAAGLVVHKQAFHTTAKCVSMVSFVKPPQTCQVPLVISRIERLLDCAKVPCASSGSFSSVLALPECQWRAVCVHGYS